MCNLKIALLVVIFSSLGTVSSLANPCQKSIVVSQDGYTNVRSAPQVRKNNIVGTLPIGLSFEQVRIQYGWVNIRAPFSGWIKDNQVSTVSCDTATQLLLKQGLSAIARFGKNAIAGDTNSAEIFLRMAQGLDGVVADTYLTALTDWALKNPSFLISVLQRQSLVIRHWVLNDLHAVWNKESVERIQFEKLLQTSPKNHLLFQEWKKVSNH